MIFLDYFGLHASGIISCVGVPEEVIKRATSLLEAVGQNKHVERLCNENISAQDQLYMVLIHNQTLDMTPGQILFFRCSFAFFFPFILITESSGQALGVRCSQWGSKPVFPGYVFLLVLKALKLEADLFCFFFC